MNTKSDWDSVPEQLLMEARARLGPPPTFEEVETYLRGELAPAEAERMRELLVCYPELAQAMVAPFPDEPHHYTPEQLAQREAAVRARANGGAQKVVVPFTPKDGRVSSLWRAATFALAATLLLAVGGVLKMRTAAPSVRGPVLVSDGDLLLPDTSRGGPVEPRTLAVSADDAFHMRVAVIEPKDFDYHIELVEANGGRVIWRSEATRPDEHATIGVSIPRAFLTPGATYRVALVSTMAGRDTPVDKYSFVAPRQ